MEIQYLKSYYRNAKGRKLASDTDPIPITELEIQNVRDKVNNGKPLPKAFEEFLAIGGAVNAISLNTTFRDDQLYPHEYFLPRLRERGILPSRPLIIFDNLHDQSSIFIYLDEGDDPQPWLASVHITYDHWEYDEDVEDSPITEIPIWKSNFLSFSSLIDHMVGSALAGIPPF